MRRLADYLACTYPPRQGSAGSLPAGETRVEFNGQLGYPHSGSAGTTGRAARGRRVPRSSSPRRRTRPPMPSPPRKCLVASTRGRGTSNRRPASGTGSLSASRTTDTTLAVRRTPCLTSHQANCRLVYPSFNGRRAPDAPLFQPQLIAALPFFPSKSSSVCFRSVAPLCHMSKVWRTCLSLRACSPG